MSTPVTPATPAAPAKPLTAIQLIEQEIVGFLKQKEAAIANVHAIDGAIQGAQSILNKLKVEAAKAEAEAKKLLAEAEAAATKVVDAVENEAKKL
jgi:hypothetical protein